MEWSATVEARSDTQATPLTDDQVAEFAERMVEHFGTVSGGAVPRYGATFSVDADSIEAASSTALWIWRKATDGLPEWPVVRAEIVEASTLEEEIATPNFPQLLGVSEVGALLGVTRQRSSLITKMPAFPKPVAQLAVGPVWTRPSIDLFLQNWPRKPGRPVHKASEVYGTRPGMTVVNATDKTVRGVRTRVTFRTLETADLPGLDREPKPNDADVPSK